VKTRKVWRGRKCGVAEMLDEKHEEPIGTEEACELCGDEDCKAVVAIATVADVVAWMVNRWSTRYPASEEGLTLGERGGRVATLRCAYDLIEELSGCVAPTDYVQFRQTYAKEVGEK
jgi:hypothetical protein